MRSNYPLDIYFQHSFLQRWNVFFAIYIRRLRRLFLRLVFVSVVSRLYPVFSRLPTFLVASYELHTSVNVVKQAPATGW